MLKNLYFVMKIIEFSLTLLLIPELVIGWYAWMHRIKRYKPNLITLLRNASEKSCAHSLLNFKISNRLIIISVL